MKDVLSFLIKNITKSSDFEIEEGQADEGRVELIVKADPSIIGMIIGKAGKTIKNIRRILSIRGVVEGKSIGLRVEEK